MGESFRKRQTFSVLAAVFSLVAISLFGHAAGAPSNNPPSAGIDLYSQCANDQGAGYSSGDTGCRWTTGDLNANNSTYHEGDATVQRLAIQDLTAGDHTLTVQYDTTKGGKHAYDFLTDDTYSENWVTDFCDPSITNFALCTFSVPQLTALIPADTNAAGHDSAVSGRHIAIRNGTWSSTGTVATGIVAAPTLVSGTYAGDSSTNLQLKFHVDPTTCANHYQTQSTDVCEVLFTWGAHVSTQVDWGTNNSAVNIKGSPYHVRVVELDGTSIGNRDNQMAATAVVVTPVVATEIHNPNHSVVALGGSVALGSTIHDQVTVTGSTPTGSATLSFYANGTCSGTPTATSGNLSLTTGVVDGTAFAEGPLTAGSYSFLAHYNGDTHNLAADGTCENFVVSPANTGTTTQVHNPSHTDVTNSSVALGTAVHDSATVGTQVGSIGITGTVTYNFYSNGTCTDPSASSQTVSVGTESSPQTLGAGSYSYKASYSGDSNYNASTGSCEPVTVNKATLGIGTQLHQASEAVVPVGGSVALGTTMHDQATVSGIVSGFAPANNVSFTFYSTSNCSDNGIGAGSIALVGNVAHPSTSEGPLAAGSYGYKATIADDSNYNGATGTCENFVVSPANTGTVTQVHDPSHNDVTNTTLGLGAVVHDSATVTGQVGNFAITGTITYNFFTNGICAGIQALTETVAVGQESSSSLPLPAGNYGYQAVYSGDSNYSTSTGVCEPFTVGQATLTVSSDVHNAAHTAVTNTNLPLGSVVHDTATLSGGVSGFSTPAIAFTLFSNGTCDGTGTAVSNVGNDEVATAVRSAATGNLVSGNYSYKASVAGNSNYIGDDSDCEPFHINTADLLLSTVIHSGNNESTDVQGTNIPLNSSVHDHGTLTGQVSGIVPLGTLGYNFYANGTCDGTPAVVDTGLSTASPSSTQSNLGAGSYSFLASYSGDANYNPATGTCEHVSVSKANTTTTTEIHKDPNHVAVTTVSLGSSVHDKAFVTTQVGSFTIGGTVSYTFFLSGDCSTGAGTPQTVNVGSESSSSGALAAGSYSYQAVYSGDNNYNTSTGACEPLTVNRAAPGVTTTLHNSDETVISSGQATTSTVHDQATVTGGVNGFAPAGSVSFSFFTNGTCSNTGAASGAGTLNGTDNPAIVHPSTAQGPLGAGSYSFQATYSGDSNYSGGTSACEPFTVTTLTINKLANGGNDTFGYTVTGPTTATPSVTTTGTPGTGTTTIVVLGGQYTVGETNIPAGWQLVGLSCASSATTLGPTSAPFTATTAQNTVCNFENSLQGKTRTQGFWATHTVFANQVWNTQVPNTEKDMTTWGACTGTITAVASTGQNRLLGGFWANIANTTTNGKRTAIDKARMQELQQLLAAMLNRWGLGAGDSGLIDQAQAAFCGTSQTAIQTKVGQLGTFNESGDTVPLGFNVPNATPSLSKSQANLAFWNAPTTH